MINKLIYITRKEQFSASHVLFNKNISKKKNKTIFDKCNNLHGHNYNLEVTIQGTPDPVTNYVFDVKKMKTIIYKNIIEKVDHKHLNDLKILNGINPTAENIVMEFWKILYPLLTSKNCTLYSIKLYETEKNIFEFRG